MKELEARRFNLCKVGFQLGDEKMKEKTFNFKQGKLTLEFKDRKKENTENFALKNFVGDCRLSLVLNQSFLKKYACFSIDYRGTNRNTDKDFEMLFSKKQDNTKVVK